MITKERLKELRKEAKLQGEGGSMMCDGGEMLELLAAYEKQPKKVACSDPDGGESCPDPDGGP